MMLNDMWNRLQREIKANAKKAGLLAGLLLFGCCIWVPMLTRAIAPARTAHAATVGAIPNPTAVAVPNVAGGPAVETNPREFWSKLAATLDDDPMFQTADVQSMTRNPFQAVETPEPLPVLFAAEPVPKAPINTDEDVKRFKLLSTIISKTRRAALINGQLYQIGRNIEADGRQYLLTTIESNRVVLSSGDQTIELTLARPQLKDVLNRNEPGSPIQ